MLTLSTLPPPREPLLAPRRLRAASALSGPEAKVHYDPALVRFTTDPTGSPTLAVPPSIDTGLYSGHFKEPAVSTPTPSPFWEQVGLIPPPGYGVSIGNNASLEFVMGVRSRDLDINVSDAVRDFSIGFVASLLSGELTTPLPLGQIEITAQGASGRGYECCRTKERALIEHWDYVSTYVRNYASMPPPLFTYMHKAGEVLTSQKVASQVRPIIFPPLHFYCLQKVHTQLLDDRIKASPAWFSYGKSVLRDHFTVVARKLQSYNYLFKGDCTKFDSSIGPWAFGVVRDIRKALAHSSSHEALDFIYDALSLKLVQLPTTHVVRDTRQPSGQACTTSDNSLFHAFVIAGAYATHFLEKKGRLPRHYEVHDALGVFLYSDDHIGATDDAEFALYSTRSRLYLQFGCILKKDDDQVGGFLSEYTYLGGALTPHPMFPDNWCYLYNDPLLLRLLPLQCLRSSQAEIAQALRSYAILLAPSPERYAELSALICHLKTLPGWHVDIPYPSRDVVLSSYFELESSV